jgi:NRPS condensation-like uncharacterized protein
LGLRPLHAQILTIPASAYDTDIGLVHKDPKSMRFNGHRRIVTIPVLRLDFIKALKNAAKVTVNDVIYAATAGEAI